MKKLLLVVYSLLVCVFCLNFADAANYEVYQDQEHGFSLEWPQGTTFVKKQPNKQTTKLGKNPVIFIMNETNLFTYPLSSAKIKDYQQSLLQRSKDTAKKLDRTFLNGKIVEFGDYKATHVVYRYNRTLANKAVPFIQDEYTFIRPYKMFMFTYILPEAAYKYYTETIPYMISTVKFLDEMKPPKWEPLKWHNCQAKGYTYSYELPVDVEDIGYLPTPDYKYCAGNGMLMSGIMVIDINKSNKAEVKQFRGLTKPLNLLTTSEQEAIFKNFNPAIVSLTKGSAKNIVNKIVMVNGVPAIKSEFDDKSSHSISYIFIKDHNFVSYDYIYEMKNASQAVPVLEKSVQSIKL